MRSQKARPQNLIPDNRRDKYSKFRYYLRAGRKRRQHVCTLTLKYLRRLWKEQEGRCALTGIPLEHAGYTINPNHQASLDRIDCRKGYIEGNVQYICLPLNLAKSSFSDATIRELIELIRET
jgi:hypothetical protein